MNGVGVDVGKKNVAVAVGNEQAAIVEVDVNVELEEGKRIDVEHINVAAVDRPARFEADDGGGRKTVELKKLLRVKVDEGVVVERAVGKNDEIVAAAGVDRVAIADEYDVVRGGADDRLAA